MEQFCINHKRNQILDTYIFKIHENSKVSCQNCSILYYNFDRLCSCKSSPSFNTAIKLVAITTMAESGRVSMTFTKSLLEQILTEFNSVVPLNVEIECGTLYL